MLKKNKMQLNMQVILCFTSFMWLKCELGHEGFMMGSGNFQITDLIQKIK